MSDKLEEPLTFHQLAQNFCRLEKILLARKKDIESATVAQATARKSRDLAYAELVKSVGPNIQEKSIVVDGHVVSVRWISQNQYEVKLFDGNGELVR